jgi:type IV pilus secretin PilQ/predicted competence protein
MFTRRPRSARELVSKAGRVPTLIAVLGLAALPHLAWAQPAKQVDEKGKQKVSVSEHNTVDLHLKDEDLSNVLELLSLQTQKNIVASKGVTGKVTATLYGVTFYQALDAILHVNGYGYIENGNFIYVYTNAELKDIQAALKKRISKSITLSYLNADDAKEMVSPLLSKDGGEIKAPPKTKDYNMPDKSPVGKDDWALGGTMVVFDYEENVKAIEALIKQIDVRPQQVLVEATILQTSLNEANAFGVDFSIIGDVNFGDFINVGGPLGAAQALIKGGNGTTGSGVSPTDNQAHAITTTVGSTASGPGGFKAGIIAGDVGIFVRMLDTVTDTVVLSNPKILALNRQPARVLVGKRVGYLNTTQTETSTTQSVQFLDTGTQLNFRPFVSADGEIRMELKPQVSSAEIRNVTDSGGHTVTIPDEITQEIVTNVNVRDGQTIVLGGLFSETSTFTRQQVPWAGDLPLLGAAFRGHDDSTVRSEIIFLITPTIVTDTLIAGAADRAGAEIERTRAGTRQKLLPFSRERMCDKLNVEAEALARQGKFAEALWKLRESLSLNPGQTEALALRERITGEREHWSDASRNDYILDSEMSKRLGTIPIPGTQQRRLKPNGSTVVPMDKLVPGGTMGQRSEFDNEPSTTTAWSTTSTTTTPDTTAIVMPGQTNVSSLMGQSVTGDMRISTADSNAVAGSSDTSTSTAAPGAATPANTTSPTTDPWAVPSQPAVQTGSAEQSNASDSNTSSATPNTVGTQMNGTVVTTATAAPSSTDAASSDFMAPQPNAGYATPTAAAAIDVSPSFTPSVTNDTSTVASGTSFNSTTSPSGILPNSTGMNTTASAPSSTPSVTLSSLPTPGATYHAKSTSSVVSSSTTKSNPTSSSTTNSSTTSASAAPTTPTTTNENASSNAPSTQTASSSPSVKANPYTAPSLSDTDKKAVADVRQTLPGLRGQIELYGLMNAGQMPNLGSGENFGWDELFTAQLMKAPPSNGYVGGPNASKVVVGESPDQSFHTNYGWIYNPKTGKLWAAGFDASDRPLSKSSSATAAAESKSDQNKSGSSATAGVETDGSNR